MSSYYFVIKQRTSASSTYTGDTYYIQWDTGLSGATDDTNLQYFTGGTYSFFNNFKHRYWSVTYDGTTPNQSVDYTMKNDDYHGGSSSGFPPTGMEVPTFALVNLYRQNHLLGLNGDVYFSDTNYIQDSRKDRIDSNGDTYETGWVFGSASSSEFWNWLGGNLTLFDVANTDQNPCGGNDIPFSATGAISYYNTNGDGYTYGLTDEESTCNIDVTNISVDGNALDKDTAYLTNYNACFTPGNICFRPYTGNNGNTIVTAYDNCGACTGGTGNDILYYSAASCCDESVYVFTADTLNGNIRGSLGPQQNTGVTINGECVGAYTQITTGYTITGTIDGYYTPSGEVMCNSCTGETPCLDYYYFEPCNGDDLYRTRQGEYDTAFGGPPVSGNVYKIENVSDIPDGCYTNVNATATTVTFNGYVVDSQSTEIPGGCSDSLCSAPTPTPTPSISETSAPTPTPTPSISETSTPTPMITPTVTPTVTTSSSSNDYQFEDCCGGYFIFSGYTGTTNIVIGQTYNYNFDGTNGVCATAVTYSGSGPSYVYSGVGNPVLAVGCEDGECPPCDSPTPTPSVTPTYTPTYTPGPTVTTSNTPTPTPSSTPGSSTETWSMTACCDSSDSIIVDVNVPGPPNVYVFYDGTSLDSATASGASESIRSWFNSNSSELGSLYEGIVGDNSRNGENWIWWMSYPYLGSMTGGTLSDSTSVVEYSSLNNGVTYSEYDSRWCKANDNGKCVPRKTQFRDDTTVYQRINRGLDLNTGSNDTRSQGVPFNHSNLTTTDESGSGTFNGGDTNYIVINIIDEADGLVGLYHGDFTNNSTLVSNPFNLIGNTWTATTPNNLTTDRVEYDYEQYLKVWEDIKQQNGRIDSLVYPVIDDADSRKGFVPHVVGIVEGETINATEYLSKYGEPITSVGPENLNLLGLSSINVFSAFTATTAYQNLDSSYQNGPGLKNFGVNVDPTVTGFTEAFVAERLDVFLESTDLSQGYGYAYTGTCYTFDSETSGSAVITLDFSALTENICDTAPCICPSPTPTPSVTPTYTPTYTPSVTTSVTPTNTLTPTPSPSDSGSCVEGVTDGTYHYTDCCGFYRSGQSVGEIVPLDPSQPYSGISLNGTPMTQNCDQGDLDYNFSVTGTCEDANGGVITISPFAGVPPYTIDNILPGTLTGGTSNQPFTWTGLSAGTYTFRLNDSLGDSNNEIYVNVNIDGCILTDIDFSGTTCGSENGYIKVSGDSTSLPYQIVLYKDGLVYSNTSSPINPTIYENLPNGEYYATIEDYGGATGQTSTVTLSGVSSLDYGLSVTGTSSCGVNTGAIEITGLTGSSPYTYLWSNGATGDTISNLSGGTYSVTVTDSNNCELIKSATVNVANGISLLSYTTTPTSCLSEDGQVTVYISGGTAPYTYAGQNGYSGTTSDTTFTFTGCSSGNFEFTITDSSNCTLTDNVNIGDLGGITSVNTRLDYVNCGSLGNVTITVVGDGGPYTYSYTGQTSGGTQSVTTSNTQQQFTNLISDTYDYKVEGSNGCCYTGEFTVSATPKFELTITTTGDTCNGGSGVIKVVPSSGYTAPLDYILSDGQSIIDTPLSAYTFYNVEEGGYTLQVVDGAGCSVSETINITGTTGVNVVITVTPGTYTTPDVLSATTLSGTAPFTYLWNDGSTGSTISAETEGTYSVLVTDSNGCQDSAQYIVQDIKTVVSSFPIVEICSDDFSTTTMTKKGFYDLLNEGYLDLIDDLGVSGCTLNSAIFNYDISYDGQVATGSFYTGYTLSDVPSDFVWAELLEDVISLFVGIQGVEVDPIQNSVKITGDCETNEFVDIQVLIEYDLDCSYVPSSPTPTPSNTATPTPTVSVTPSVSITPTSTPAATETVTPTPSVTSSITPTNTPSVTVSDTPGVSQTPTPTVSVTQTETSTPTPTSTITPTVTNSQTPGSTQTPTPTVTQTPTLTSTVTQTVTVTPSISDTPSVTPTNTPSVSVSNTPGVSQTATPTVTPTISETSTPTPTPTSSVTPSVSNTPGSTQTPTPTNTSTPTSSPTVTNTPSSTVTVTPSISETSTLTPTPTNTVTPTISETSTPTPTPTISETSTPTPTVTPSTSETSTPTPTPTISETATPTPTPTVSSSAPLETFTVYVSSTLSENDCDKFTASITKNGSVVVTITKNSNALPVLSTNNFQATTADNINVSVQNATPTGAGCGEAITTTAIETGHITLGNYVVRDSANGNSATASYSFNPNNSNENSIIVRFPWTP